MTNRCEAQVPRSLSEPSVTLAALISLKKKHLFLVFLKMKPFFFKKNVAGGNPLTFEGDVSKQLQLHALLQITPGEPLQPRQLPAAPRTGAAQHLHAARAKKYPNHLVNGVSSRFF